VCFVSKSSNQDKHQSAWWSWGRCVIENKRNDCTISGVSLSSGEIFRLSFSDSMLLAIITEMMSFQTKHDIVLFSSKYAGLVNIIFFSLCTWVMEHRLLTLQSLLLLIRSDISAIKSRGENIERFPTCQTKAIIQWCCW
jgi:hypothetical protein